MKVKGRWGERIAARYLQKQGYDLIGLSYSTRYGEIDVIAENKRYIAFVEVKTRSSESFAKPREFVDVHKQRRLISAAQMWLAENETKKQPRFDVIEILAPNGPETEMPKINHIENAFGADL